MASSATPARYLSMGILEMHKATHTSRANSFRTFLCCFLGTGLILTAGCKFQQESQAEIANGPDPVAALSADVESTRYGSAYWSQQSDSNTALWQQAKDYCAKNAVTASGQKVNCGAVMVVSGTETIRHPERRKPGERTY